MKKIILIISVNLLLISTISAQQAGEIKVPIKVSFISYGSGIDGKALQKLDEVLKKYESLPADKTAWGREGEIDYCFKLEGVKRRKKKKFIKEIKSLMSTYEMVRIEENAICNMNKRK